MHVKSHSSFGIKPEKNPKMPSSLKISLIDDQIDLKIVIDLFIYLFILFGVSIVAVFRCDNWKRQLKVKENDIWSTSNIHLLINCFTANKLGHHSNRYHLKGMCDKNSRCVQYHVTF